MLAGVSMQAAAAPPSTDTSAPMMDRSLDEALVLEPGATCLARDKLITEIRAERIKNDPVDERLEIHVNGSSEHPHSVHVSIWIDGQLWMERPFNEKKITSCADLYTFAGLAVAIMLDDLILLEQAQAEESDLPDFSDDEPEEEPTERRRGPPLAVMAAGAAFIGVTPQPSFGGLLSFDIRPLDHFDVRIGALATHLSGFRLDSPGYDEGRVDVTVAAGRVDLCWGTAPRRVRGRVCGGVAGGAAVSAGHGYTTDFRRTTPWFAGLAGFDLSVQLIGPLALELRLEGVFPLQRTVLDIRSASGQLLARERFPLAGMIIAVGPRIEF